MKITLLSTSITPADQGLRTLSACLKIKGHKVKLIFLPLQENDYSTTYSQDIMNQLDKEIEGSKLIGIGAMSSTSTRALHLTEHYQKKGIHVVWGGPGPTFFPEKCFKKCNIIALGECEQALVELADKIEKNKDITKIKNLWVKKAGKEYKNDVRPLLGDLDKLAHPDYNIKTQLILENKKLIPFEEKHLGGTIFFQTERGCPQACAYCTNHILKQMYKGKGKILRTHSVDYVIDELKKLHKEFPSIGSFDLRDETFTIRDMEWIKEFSEKYITSGIGIRLKCLAEPATLAAGGISEEKIKLLVNAGLTDIIIGIQSGSDRVNFEVFNRFLTKKQLIKTAEVINKFKDKLTVMYDIITCNPYETNDDILETINLILKIPPPFFLSVNNLVFFEGTPLYDKAIKDNIIKPDDPYLNYWDRWQHIKQKNKNHYITLVLNLMRGVANKKRIGLIPRSILKELISKKSIKFNTKHLFPTKIAGNLTQVFDNIREKVAKPIYRKTSPRFKNWYDKKRYK